MTEAEVTTLFLKWSKARFNQNFAFEAKICKTKSLPFDSVKTHQENALYAVKHGIFNYKIPDTAYSPLPFDGFMFFRAKAYVIIFWYQKKGDRRITIIDIDFWLEKKQSSPKKSLTFTEACEIGRLEII